MRINTFFQLCIYICITMIVFTLAINFVNATDVFSSVEMGKPVGGNASDTFEAFAGVNMNAIWAIVLTVSGIAAVVVAILMHSAIPVGAYIFSAVFWTSYFSALGVLDGLHIPPEFRLIGTTIMLFFWAGALAGMFSGSG